MVVKTRFNREDKINQLLDLIQSKSLTLNHAKIVMAKIVEGDRRTPLQIA